MTAPSTSDPILLQCAVRRFRSDDAPGVTQLVRSVYGDTYYPPALYDPSRIVELNESGKFVSILALHEASGVIGHYALEMLQCGFVAEASDAIVAMDFRHHHLMEEMRVLLREEANRIGLTGLVGYPVTNHLFSQKAEEHFGAFPCGIAPGLWPRSFHNMPEELPQRMSFVIYFKYLRPQTETVHASTAHAEMLTRIARQWGVSVRQLAPAAASGTGEIVVEHEPALQTGSIRVVRVGADSIEAIRVVRKQLLGAGVKAISLELPLAQAATSELVTAADALGFFFIGLGPAFASDGDAIMMQYLAEDIDPSLIQLDNAFAKEMLAYVEVHRQRAKSIP